MATCRAQVTLVMVSNIPEDSVVNTFHFQSPVSPNWAGTDGFKDKVAEFYSAFATYFSPFVAQNNHTIKVYDLADPEPRAPIYSDTFNLSADPSGDALPTEVALCISFQAEQVSGTPQSRRRGRIYIGPLDTTATDANGRPADALRTAAANAMENFIEGLESDGSFFMGVYSRVDEELHQPIEDGWVDNAFDTQRRRGLAATARTVFNITH